MPLLFPMDLPSSVRRRVVTRQNRSPPSGPPLPSSVDSSYPILLKNASPPGGLMYLGPQNGSGLPEIAQAGACYVTSKRRPWSAVARPGCHTEIACDLLVPGRPLPPFPRGRRIGQKPYRTFTAPVERGAMKTASLTCLTPETPEAMAF